MLARWRDISPASMLSWSTHRWGEFFYFGYWNAARPNKLPMRHGHDLMKWILQQMCESIWALWEWGVGGGGRNDDDDDDNNDGDGTSAALKTHWKCIFAHLTHDELSPTTTHLARALWHRIQFFIIVSLGAGGVLLRRQWWMGWYHDGHKNNAVPCGEWKSRSV